jgi:hypothetical protein
MVHRQTGCAGDDRARRMRLQRFQGLEACSRASVFIFPSIGNATRASRLRFPNIGASLGPSSTIYASATKQERFFDKMIGDKIIRNFSIWLLKIILSSMILSKRFGCGSQRQAHLRLKTVPAAFFVCFCTVSWLKSPV